MCKPERIAETATAQDNLNSRLTGPRHRSFFHQQPTKK
jgi:hypothetical protein